MSLGLPRLAREFAGQIAYTDWSDAPYRCDGAGHRPEFDSWFAAGKDNPNHTYLDEKQTERVRLNVVWNVAQVLAHAGVLRDEDDIYAFAEAAGVDTRTVKGRRSRAIILGLRRHPSGWFCPPNHPDDLIEEEAGDDDQ